MNLRSTNTHIELFGGSLSPAVNYNKFKIMMKYPQTTAYVLALNE